MDGNNSISRKRRRMGSFSTVCTISRCFEFLFFLFLFFSFCSAMLSNTPNIRNRRCVSWYFSRETTTHHVLHNFPTKVPLFIHHHLRFVLRSTKGFQYLAPLQVLRQSRLRQQLQLSISQPSSRFPLLIRRNDSILAQNPDLSVVIQLPEVALLVDLLLSNRLCSLPPTP